MNTFITSQNWRYATKMYDSGKKISDSDLNILKEAIRLSASSYGLQPYKVLIIENPEIREKLKPAAWNQSQITDASHLVVFANKTGFGDADIDSHIENVSAVRGIPVESISGFGDFMKSKITPLPEDVKNTWTSKQTYIALGNLLAAAAELHIDATPMEGFDADAFNEILGLKQQGLNASVIAAIGYRHNEDLTQAYKKVRKPHTELFINL
ncbi:MAG: NAD(P)H-dependent oxidoreductase [Flavobacterium sp.]|nr:MAG: NAD(P)H-dependent oxidoreductase [Flavobacterium sp.]